MTDESLYSSSCYALETAGIREIQGWYVGRCPSSPFRPASTSTTFEGAECGAITKHFLMAKFNRRTVSPGSLPQPGALLGSR